jgi:hypothetical protein
VRGKALLTVNRYSQRVDDPSEQSIAHWDRQSLAVRLDRGAWINAFWLLERRKGKEILLEADYLSG